jgi:hypothetical protein
MKNPAELITPSPLTDHVTGILAVNCWVPPVVNVIALGEMMTSVLFVPPQLTMPATTQPNKKKMMMALFNRALRGKIDLSCWD